MLLYKHTLDKETHDCVIQEIETRESPMYYIIDIILPYTVSKAYRSGKYVSQYTRRIPKNGLDVLTVHDEMFSMHRNEMLFCQLMTQRLNQHILNLQAQEEKDRQLIQLLQQKAACSPSEPSESAT